MFRLLSLRRIMWLRTAVAGLLVCLSGFLLLTGLVVQPPYAHAVTNNYLNFQARLMDSTGAIVQDGYYNVEFKIYSVNQADGGETPLQGSCTTNPGAVADEDCLWTEAYYDTNGVTAGNDFRVRVVNGYLTANLGSRTSFPTTINWDQDLYITMNVGGTTQTASPTYDGEMTNSGVRMRLTGVPYAFRAGQLAKYNGTSGFTSVLKLEDPTVGNQTFQVPDQGAAGTYNLCVVGSSSCGFASTANAFVQGGNDFNTAAILGTTDNDALTFITNNTEKMRVTTGGTLEIGSTGSPGTVEKLRVNTPNTVDNTAEVIFTAGAAGRIPLVVQANGSQSASLTEWQNSSGTSLLTISSVGAVTLTGGSTGTTILSNGANRKVTFGGSASGLASILTVNANSSGNVAIVVKGAASQTADLQQWQDSSGNGLLRISASGVLGSLDKSTASTNSTAVTLQSGNATGTTSNSGNVVIDAGTATGTTGQIQIGNTSASSLTIGRSGVSTTLQGNIVVSSLGTADTNTHLCRNTSNQIATCSATGTGSAFVQGGNDFNADAVLGTTDADPLTFITNNTEKMRLTTGGVLELNSTGTPGTVEKFRVNLPTTVDNLANAIIGTSATTSKGLVVQGVASQAANLQEWQNSGGTPVASVSSAGLISGSVIAAGTNPAQSGTIRIPNAEYITARNNTNSADLDMIRITTAGQIQFGQALNGISMGNGTNITVGTSTGTKIGTSASQKLGFFNATPVVQPASTTDLRQALIDLGLYATGGATPLNLNGGSLTAGTTSISGTLTLSTLGTADTNTQLCRNTSNQIASCSTTGAGAAFVQDGNSFGALATLGTNDANSLAFETNGVTKMTLDTTGNLTLGQASVLSTSAGALTVQGFSTTTVASANQSAGSTNSANVVVNTGNAAGATSTAGNIVLDVGTSTTSNGSILIGTAARAQTITIGNSTGGAVRIGQNGGTLQLDGTNFDVSTAGVLTLAGGQTADITTAAATTSTAIVLQPGTSSGASSNGPAVSIKGGDGSGTTTVVGGALTLQGGNATGGSGTRTGGAVTIDGGTGATANGAINIGTTNAASLLIGRSGVNTTLQGNVLVTTLGSADTSTHLCRNTSNQIASCSTTGTGVAFVQGGNSFGATGILGTNDSNNLEIETNNTTRLTIDTSGNAAFTGNITAGTYNTTTLTGSALTFGTAGTATIQSAASQALNITAHAGSTFSTDSGTLTLQGFSNSILKSANQSGASTNSGSVSITSGNAAGTTSNSGLINIDVGTATGTTGAIDIGDTNASAINMGRNTISTTVAGRLITSHSDSSTTLWGRADDVSFINTNGTNDTWTGIGFNDGGSTAAGIAAQYYNTASDYGRLVFSTRGAAGFTTNNLVLQNGNVGIGVAAPTTSKLQFAADTVAAGGITFGTDTNLYRAAADILMTDDSFIIGTAASATTLTINGTAGIISTSSSGNNIDFSRAGANYITATDAAGTLQFGSGGNQGQLILQQNGNLNFTGSNTITSNLTDASLNLQSNGNGAISLDSGTTGAINIGTGTDSKTVNIATSAANTKTQAVNIGTSGTAGSTTNVTIGSLVAGTTTIQGAGVVTGRTSGSTTAFTVNNSTSTGSILALQDNASPVFTVADGGNITATGLYNTNTFTSSSLNFGAAGPANITSSTGQSLSLIGQTTMSIASGATGSTSTNSGNVTIATGGAFGATSTAGNIVLDVGTSTTSNGSILIGTAARAQTITIGNSTGGAVRIGQNGGTLQLDGTNFDVSTAGVLTLAGGQTADITTAAATTSTAIVLQPGTSSGASSNGPAVSIKGGDGSGTTTVVGGALTLQGGNATGGSGTRTGGAVTIDGGYGGASGTNGGVINIGTTNASGLNIGRSSITTTYLGRLTVSRTDSDTTMWGRVDDISYINPNGTNNTWTGIGFNDGGAIAAGFGAQYYDTTNDYARLIFSTRGAGGFTSSTMVLQDGRAGFGATPSTYRLEVTDSQASNYVARIQNSNTANTADGLLIDLGVANASRGTGNYFVGFAGAGTVGGKIQGCANAASCVSTGTGPGVSYTTTGADYAEFYKADPNNLPQSGEIVQLDSTQNQTVKEANNNSNQPLVGVISSNAGFVGNGPLCNVGDEDCDTNYAKYNVLVGLVGQVAVKVNNSKGDIKVGDPVGLSSVVGEGAKVTGNGHIIGYAEEDQSDPKDTIKVLLRPQYHVSNVSNMSAQPLSRSSNSDIVGNLNVSGKTNLTNLKVSHSVEAGSLKVTGMAQIDTLKVINLLTTKELRVMEAVSAKSVKVEQAIELGGDLIFSTPINTKQSATIRKFKANQPIKAGSVVVLDATRAGYVATTTKNQDTRVIGVATNDVTEVDQEVLVAVSGQVQVNISDDVVITSGDLLVSDAKAGFANRTDEPKTGAMLGKATSQLDPTNHQVWLLLTLQ